MRHSCDEMAGGSSTHSRGANSDDARQASDLPRTNSYSSERNGSSALPEATDTPDFGQPPEWERRCRDLWRQGAQVVRKPDGSVDDWDVIHWLLTRKGGANTVWPELEEGRQAIEAMRRETLDMNRIHSEIIEEWEERERRESRRLHNKWLCRPRREVREERERRRAEEAASKAQAAAESGPETGQAVNREQNGGQNGGHSGGHGQF